MLGRWLGGEAFIAASGLALAAAMVGVVCASAWWAMRSQHTTSVEAAHQRVRAMAAVLANAAEAALAKDQGADLRSQVLAGSVAGGLSTCRVRLADGGVLASSSPEPLVKAGSAWPAWPVAPETSVSDLDSLVRVSQPVRVPGRGIAVLEAEAPLPVAAFGHGQAETGIAAAGVAGMLLLWWVYRRLRGRLRVLGAIRESLLAAADGEGSSAALAVACEFGPEAQGWNALLGARDSALLGQAEVLGTERRRADGEGGGEPTAHEALDCLWLGVMLLDSDMKVVYANGAVAVLLRLRREELVGRAVAELFPEEAARAALAGVVGGTVRHRVQWEVERKNEGGSPCVTRVSLKPARKGDSFTAFALVEDVSQQRVADKSRNALIAQASHELRTPLTNIRLYAEALLEDQGENPSSRATAINVINQESRRLERIVADMLSVSEIEAGSFRMRRDDIPIASILDDLRHDFAPQAQDKEIKLVFDIAPKLPTLTGDRDKITLALHNLVGNAIKYTPAGGTVTVKAGGENPGTAGETLVVEVVDTGIGVKPEEQEQIFERFFRSADKRIASITGTGLGLTLSREVARLHGGDVTLKSKLNEGSSFTFRIPASAESPGFKQAA